MFPAALRTPPNWRATPGIGNAMSAPHKPVTASRTLRARSLRTRISLCETGSAWSISCWRPKKASRASALALHGLRFAQNRNVIARVVENVRADTLCDFVREAVSHKVSLLCTARTRTFSRPQLVAA